MAVEDKDEDKDEDKLVKWQILHFFPSFSVMAAFILLIT